MQQVLEGAMRQGTGSTRDQSKANVPHIVQVKGPTHVVDDGENGGQEPLHGCHGIAWGQGQQLGQLQPAGFDQQDGQDESSSGLGAPQAYLLLS
jgi:hypothetical protein